MQSFQYYLDRIQATLNAKVTQIQEIREGWEWIIFYWKQLEKLNSFDVDANNDRNDDDDDDIFCNSLFYVNSKINNVNSSSKSNVSIVN